MWRGISPRRSDAYFRAYSEVLDAVLTTKAIDVLAVHRAIQREYGRWRVYSIDRLRQFGHSCDSF